MNQRQTELEEVNKQLSSNDRKEQHECRIQSLVQNGFT